LKPTVEEETNEVPLYARSCPEVKEEALVPPFAIGKIPVR
jgi:hypothetical protein